MTFLQTEFPNANFYSFLFSFVSLYVLNITLSPIFSISGVPPGFGGGRLNYQTRLRE